MSKNLQGAKGICCCIGLGFVGSMIGLVISGGDEVAAQFFGFGTAGGFGTAAVALLAYAVCRKQRNTQSEKGTQQSVPTVPPTVIVTSAKSSQPSATSESFPPEMSGLLSLSSVQEVDTPRSPTPCSPTDSDSERGGLPKAHFRYIDPVTTRTDDKRTDGEPERNKVINVRI